MVFALAPGTFAGQVLLTGELAVVLFFFFQRIASWRHSHAQAPEILRGFPNSLYISEEVWGWGGGSGTTRGGKRHGRPEQISGETWTQSPCSSRFFPLLIFSLSLPPPLDARKRERTLDVYRPLDFLFVCLFKEV